MNSKLVHAVIVGIVGLLTMVVPVVAQAGVYDLVARYKAMSGANADFVDIVIEKNDLIPIYLHAYTLDQVLLKVGTDNVSKSSLESLRNIVVFTSPPYQEDPRIAWQQEGVVNVDGVSAPDVSATKILDVSQLVGAPRFERVKVKTKAKYLPTYLCAQELDLRKAKGQKNDDPKLDGVFGFASANPKSRISAVDKNLLTYSELQALLLLRERGLKNSRGQPIVYSFCSGIVAHLNWDAVGQIYPNLSPDLDSLRTAADMAQDHHKHELMRMIKKEWDAQGSMDHVLIGRDAPNLPENMYVEEIQHFSLIHNERDMLAFSERGGGKDIPLNNIIDQESQVFFKCSDAQARCGEFVDRNFAMRIEVADAGEKEASLAAEISKSGAGWLVNLPLKDYLDKSITFVSVYKKDDVELVLRRDEMNVRNLGFVMSFPIVSEIQSVVIANREDANNPQDLEFKSSIPISWAFNLGAKDKRHVAITFPWMIGYNFRSATKFADVVRLFPHVSVIFPISKGADSTKEGTSSSTSSEDQSKSRPPLQIALGAGISLASAFSIAWGMTVDNGANYVLLGISIQDLVNLTR